MIAVLAQEKQSNPLGSLVILLPLIVAFYFVAIRPGRKRVQAMQSVQASLAPGREVVTAGGVYARVAAVEEADGTVLLEIAPGVEVRFARGAIVKVVDDETLPEALPAPDDE